MNERCYVQVSHSDRHHFVAVFDHLRLCLVVAELDQEEELVMFLEVDCRSSRELLRLRGEAREV